MGVLASQVWPQVIKEPIVNEATVATCDLGLRLDLGIRGVWQPQGMSVSPVGSIVYSIYVACSVRFGWNLQL